MLISWNIRRGSEGNCDKNRTPSLRFEPDTFPNTNQQHHCSNFADSLLVDDIPQCLYEGKEVQATTDIGLNLQVLYKKVHYAIMLWNRFCELQNAT